MKDHHIIRKESPVLFACLYVFIDNLDKILRSGNFGTYSLTLAHVPSNCPRSFSEVIRCDLVLCQFREPLHSMPVFVNAKIRTGKCARRRANSGAGGKWRSGMGY